MVSRLWFRLMSRHITGVFNAARTSSRGTRSSATYASLVTLNFSHRAAWMMLCCLVLLRTYNCCRCRSRRLTWNVSRRCRRLAQPLTSCRSAGTPVRSASRALNSARLQEGSSFRLAWPEGPRTLRFIFGAVNRMSKNSVSDHDSTVMLRAGRFTRLLGLRSLLRWRPSL